MFPDRPRTANNAPYPINPLTIFIARSTAPEFFQKHGDRL
jgi:hypothetical protein